MSTRNFVLAWPHLQLVSLGCPVNGLHEFALPFPPDLGEAGLVALGSPRLVNPSVPTLNGRKGSHHFNVNWTEG